MNSKNTIGKKTTLLNTHYVERIPKGSTLILTGAIHAVWGERLDPVVRLNDQLCALRRWLSVEGLDQIIYVDAGGCTVPEHVINDFNPHGRDYTCFSVDYSELARLYEGGRAEAESINHVLEQMPEITRFYKCTGRYFIDNFQNLQQFVAEQPDAEHVVRTMPERRVSPRWIDTRVFYMTRSAWMTNIAPRISELTSYSRRGEVIEGLFYSCFEPNPSFTKTKPVIIGYAGSVGWMWDGDFTPEEKQFAQDLIVKYGISTFIP